MNVRALVGGAILLTACAAQAQSKPFSMRTIWATKPSAAIHFQYCGPVASFGCTIYVQVESIDMDKKTCNGSVADSSGNMDEIWVIVRAATILRPATLKWSLLPLPPSVPAGTTAVFATSGGIALVGNSATKDFKDPVSGGAQFTWKSINTRLRAVSYDVNLTVTPPAPAAPFDCPLTDPIIINRGN